MHGRRERRIGRIGRAAAITLTVGLTLGCAGAQAQRPGPTNTITDIAGIEVGHDSRTGDGYLTGTTVILTRAGATASVDVQGGAPGTRETDLLAPGGLVTQVHAIVLSGGSAYGLAAADGTMRWLEEQGIGFPIAGGVVPIVPSAILFGSSRCRLRLSRCGRCQLRRGRARAHGRWYGRALRAGLGQCGPPQWVHGGRDRGTQPGGLTGEPGDLSALRHLSRARW